MSRSTPTFPPLCHVFDYRRPAAASSSPSLQPGSPSAQTGCDLTPVLLRTLPGLLPLPTPSSSTRSLSLRLSGRTCMLCGQLTGPPLRQAGAKTCCSVLFPGCCSRKCARMHQWFLTSLPPSPLFPRLPPLFVIILVVGAKAGEDFKFTFQLF